MNQKKIGMAFSREFIGNDPLGHIGVKKPVYHRFLELCTKRDWDAYILTRKTYKEFPPEGDESAIWINRRDFKILAWDKWAAYREIGHYMPQTLLVEDEKEIPVVVDQIKTDRVVLKPFNGLKGLGIFIGPKNEAKNFKFTPKYKRYIAQEFVDTSSGISGIVSGMHDLRVVIINGEVVWCHVREPVGGSLLANAAQGGNLTEVDYRKVPRFVKDIVENISKEFYKKYDNPVYSLDFGVGKNGVPKIFEINDQIGFPKWEMKNRDNFLNFLVKNMADKLA
ncbi:MAG: ATP-grasp domain protein [Candidatus Woesebacteria bacterium GW2011_GWA2_40_7b]|uniref:ATP-grasp domain protein n=1 Tax=Candidatus Woesebacteria bacterium GW2011_GWA2_40_7b TaxID=1618563 RepID=A0A0G0T990_9BACT|nr:MAG: ATP-grasp domain protein [Candidatus Woesebacteria bacterium GW2011_GWA2_40_7b]